MDKISNNDLRLAFVDLLNKIKHSPLAGDEESRRPQKRPRTSETVQPKLEPKEAVHDRLQRRIYALLKVPFDAEYDAFKLAA